jgi:CRISPR-associated protein Csx10
MTPDMTTAGFDVHLTFLSDWHVGTGAGRVGAIDACVHRDHDGLPFVPAKTLTGVWRDACETVAVVLDGGPAGTWSDWVTTMFGGHERGACAPAMLAIGPARLPDDVADALRAHPALREAMVVHRPGVAIDPATGTALEDCLRLEERVTTGVTLSTRVEALRLHPGTPFPAEAEFLLRAGARLVDALGGKRSRGAGRVALRLGPSVSPPPAGGSAGQGQDGTPPDARLRELLDDATLLASPADPPPLHLATRDLTLGRPNDSGRTTRRITLTVRTPVVVPDRLRGNLLTTHDRVLGTGLLPAILDHIPKNVLPGVLLGDIRVTDAVPAVLIGDEYVPAYPAPLVWHCPDKGDGQVMLNLARAAAPPKAKAKPVKARIVRGSDGRWQKVQTGTVDRTHAVIDDDARRPVESAGGGLFTFEGIPAGTVLVTDVVLPDGVDLGLASGDRMRLGRSRKDDFGLVEVRSVEVRSEPTPALPTPGPNAVQRLTVWCLSDVLPRSVYLSPDPTPEGLAAALGTALGTTLTPVRAPENDDRRPTATTATRREGFAVRWGRPRPSQIALAAGSVVTLDVTGPPVTAEALARIERDGIGARRAEGYGQILFNPPDFDKDCLELDSDDPPKGKAKPAGARIVRLGPPPTSAPDVLHGVLRRAWRTAIRRKVEELAASRDLLDLLLPEAPPPRKGSRKTRPTASQLGQLRAQLERHPDHVRDWFAGLRASGNRNDSWTPHAIDAAEVLLLDSLAPVPAGGGRTAPPLPTVWEHLRMADSWASTDQPPEEVRELYREMTAEARALLLVAMHRQSRRGIETSPGTTTDVTLEEVR